MSEATVDADLREWRAFLQGVRKSGETPVPILRAVFNTFGFADIQDHFRKQEGPEGRWASRAPSTQEYYAAIASGRRNPPKGASRAQFNPSNKLLQMTGALRQSIIPSNVKQVSKEAIMVFSNIDYSGQHDQGAAKRRLPQRQFMWLGDQAQNDMAQMAIELWLKKGTDAV